MAFKLPSFTNIYTHLMGVLRRFPFECAMAVAGTWASIQLLSSNGSSEGFYINIMMTTSLGLSFLLAGNLYSRSLKDKKAVYWITQMVLVLLVLFYHQTLSLKLTDLDLIRYLVLNICGHLLVSFVPFLHHRDVNAFWHFNKILFIRILTAVLYSLVLFGGLAGAIGSVEALFEVDLDNDIYLQLFSIIAGLFNTIFFLGGIPAQPEHSHVESVYPKGLKMFTQYVLVPLVFIYLTILLSYEVKILSSFKLPEGWISWLVLGFSIAGILANLLVYPLRDSSDNKWIRFFAKWFYLFLLPLLGLFYWAILYRISEYGVTEERYYVLLLAIWLSGITLYFIFSKSKNILFIPLTLALLGLQSLGGPQGASSVSLSSQLKRLEKTLASDSILTSRSQQKASSRIVDYCLETHGYEVLEPIFGTGLDSIFYDTINDYRHSSYYPSIMKKKLMALKGLVYYERHRYNWGDQYYNIATKNDEMIKLDGYEYLFDVSGDHARTFSLNNGDIISMVNDSKHLVLTFNQNKKYYISHANHIKPLISKLDSGNQQEIYDAESNADNYHHFSIAPEHMYFDYSAGKDYKVRILYKMLSLEKKEESDSLSINEIDCFLLVKKMN